MYVDKKGSGRSVVLIHGLGAHLFSWRKAVEKLSPHFTTYAVDLLGFGKSAAPTPFAYTAKAQSEKLAVWIEAKGFSKPPHIVGHSMGGAICCYLAQTAKSGALGKMVLIAAVAPDLPPQMKAALAAVSAMPAMPDANSPVVAKFKAKRLLELAYAKTSPVEDEQIDGYAEGLSKPGQNHALKEHAATLEQVKFTKPELEALKTKIKTLVIWGEEDPWLPLTQGETLATWLGADIKKIKNCGHIPQEEKADKTNEFIKEFLLK